ncbi:MAG: 30S ribosomal protein S6 [Ignavibacteria bacterium]|nr:30S ribosomal protein S6 [Ignavibacteria bacterium]MBT8380802.1 30S ribosomal protein S6 [Ignavibacteria bacterium]NNJ54314.1 30S ribosomal protein S6 [Ignavibacteriaceae bacterium]
MIKRAYESAVLINAALEDEAIQTIISKIKETILNNGGDLRDVEDWGRKRLAYIVKKSKIGYYVFFRFDALPDLVPVLERYYLLDENILRYLTIKLTAEALEQIEIDKSKQTEIVEEIDEPIVPSSDNNKSEEENSAVEQPIKTDSMED